MMRTIEVVIVGLAAAPAVSNAIGQSGVDGTTVRPVQDSAKAEGSKIAKPGDYEMAVGHLIELDYT